MNSNRLTFWMVCGVVLTFCADLGTTSGRHWGPALGLTPNYSAYRDQPAYNSYSDRSSACINGCPNYPDRSGDYTRWSGDFTHRSRDYTHGSRDYTHGSRDYTRRSQDYADWNNNNNRCVDGHFYGDQNSRTAFGTCVHGRVVSRQCAPGLDWDNGNQRCDWPRSRSSWYKRAAPLWTKRDTSD